jgi:leader peptidase (prepilin peptidase)/N-methyltransferase
MPAEILCIGALLAPVLGVGCAWAVRRLSGDRPPVLGAPATAALEALLILWALAAAKLAVFAASSVALSAALLTLALVDMSTFRLPDLITLPLIAAGLAAACLERTGLADHAIGALAGWTAIAALASGFHRATGRRGIGMGDAKLLAAAGAWCGWEALPAIVVIACGLAFTWVAVRLARQGRTSLAAPLPFGAPLVCAFWFVRLYGPML